MLLFTEKEFIRTFADPDSRNIGIELSGTGFLIIKLKVVRVLDERTKKKNRNSMLNRILTHGK